ncbi:glycosyltransferase [Kiritimatiellaeota bacterium B1221]|nr:glycosyltransferase [Kiritimatiellaeota bacterium B1221]
MNEIHLSCCIPTSGRYETLLETIRLLATLATPSIQIEFVVVDQTDLEQVPPDIETRLRDKADSHSVCYEHTVVKNANAARNRCVQLSKAELLVFLDDDILPGPGLLECLHKHLSKNPALVAATGQCYHRDVKKDVDWQTLTVSQPEQGTTPHFSALSSTQLEYGLKNHVLVGACMAVRKSAVIAVGGFDEQLKSYCDEGDLSKRLERVFGKETFIFDPAVYIVHLRTPSGGHKINMKGHGKKEKDIITSILLYMLRYEGRLIYTFFRSLRIGPLRKENVTDPRKWFMAIGAWAGAWSFCLKNLNRVMSPFSATLTPEKLGLAVGRGDCS